MTDRELLELAAKAVGLFPTVSCKGEPAWTTGQGSGCFEWNPLTDDGDALRLAVEVERHHDSRFWSKVVARRSVFDFAHDPAGATRRAIVIVVAELGEKAA